jgi:hypothetical protein
VNWLREALDLPEDRAALKAIRTRITAFQDNDFGKFPLERFSRSRSRSRAQTPTRAQTPSTPAPALGFGRSPTPLSLDSQSPSRGRQRSREFSYGRSPAYGSPAYRESSAQPEDLPFRGVRNQVYDLPRLNPSTHVAHVPEPYFTPEPSASAVIVPSPSVPPQAPSRVSGFVPPPPEVPWEDLLEPPPPEPPEPSPAVAPRLVHSPSIEPSPPPGYDAEVARV